MKLVLPDPELFWESESTTTGQIWWTLRIREVWCGNYYVATISNSPEQNQDFFWQSYNFAGAYLDTGFCNNLEDAKQAAIASLVHENIITVY